MCIGGSAPKPPPPPPPPKIPETPPPPPPPSPSAEAPADESHQDKIDAKTKRRGTRSLRVELNTGGGKTGLNVPR